MVRTIAEDAPEQRVLDDIAEHGWHVVSVLEEEGHVPHLFTIGLGPTFSFPEILIIGLDSGVAHSMTNIVVEWLRKQRRPGVGRRIPDLLEGYDCIFVNVRKEHYRDYVGFALWYYEGDGFPLIQCVWPDKQGRFPWDERASDGFRETQPILGGPPP